MANRIKLKKELLKYWSILLIWFGLLPNLLGQDVSKTVFENAVEGINCMIIDFALKNEAKQPHYATFNTQIRNQCEFFTLVSFLKTRDSLPISTIELVYQINSYKTQYKSTADKEDLAFLLTSKMFAEPALKAFSSAPQHSKLFPTFKRSINDYILTVFNLGGTTTTTIGEEEDEIEMVEQQDQEEEQEPELEDLEEEAKEAEQIDNYIDHVHPPPPSQPFFDWSATWFRIAILILLLALVLYIVLPYYEKRYKAFIRNKPGNEIHPTVIGLKADIEGLKNRNRLLKEELKALNYYLDDLEREGK